MRTRPAPTPAPAWRVIALLAILVLLAHLLVLGLLPGAGGPEPLPLAGKFITRTIVIAPPAPARPPAEAAAKPPPPRPRPPPPRPKPPPAEAAAPETSPPPTAPAGPAPTPAPQETGAPADTAPANAAGDGGAGAQSASEAPPGDGPDAGNAGGGPPDATQPLRIHGAVRLAFDLSGQRGAQPMSGAFGELVWLQDGQDYDARLSLRFLFKTFLRWTSSGRLDASGIAPLRFSETKRGEAVALLLRDEGRVAFSGDRPDAPAVPLLAGAQDRLSVIMQLGAMLAGDAGRHPAGSRIALQTVGPRNAAVWNFQVGGEERIQVPAGEFTVRQLERDARQAGDYRLELWLAPELGYLPVRLRMVQPGGDLIELQLRSISTP